MSDLCRLIWHGLIGLFWSHAALEVEILVLRHQLNILRRKSSSSSRNWGRKRMFQKPGQIRDGAESATIIGRRKGQSRDNARAATNLLRLRAFS